MVGDKRLGCKAFDGRVKEGGSIGGGSFRKCRFLREE